MEFSQLVEIRRSIRGYKEAKINIEDIYKIIECATLAPSWKNSETGRYYVALGQEAINEIYNDLPLFNQNSSKNAAYIVATFKKGISGLVNEVPNDYWGAYDLGLQNAYMMLKASELGYDTLVMGLRDEEKIKKYFNIPEDEMMLPVIAIGIKNAEPRNNIRKKVEEILTVK